MEENKAIPVDTPKSMDEVIRGLKGFGLEENEEILSFNAGGRTVRLRISNIPTEQEIKALDGTESSRATLGCSASAAKSCLGPLPGLMEYLSTLSPSKDIVWSEDPTCQQQRGGNAGRHPGRAAQHPAGWGQEVLQTLWKVLMVHCDSIEKRMQQSFPQSALMTEVERRFFEAALKEIRDTSREVIEDTIAKTVEEHLTPEERAELNGTEAKKA